MSEDLEDLKSQIKSCVLTTQENSIAIKGLITLSEQSTKDIDRLVTHIDNLIPIHEKISSAEDKVSNLEREANDGIRPKTLKTLLYWGVGAIVLFGSWTTLMFFNYGDKINENKNQITYLKGRIK